MRHKLTYIVIFLLVACSLACGWKLFCNISHNRMVKKINIFAYCPTEALSIMYFNSKKNLTHFQQQDSFNLKIINSIKDKITYPLAIINFPDDKVIISRVTTGQEELLKKELMNLTGFSYAPIIRKENGYTLFFYNLSDNLFITATFHKGLFLICRDYHQIDKILSNPRKEDCLFLEQTMYLQMALENSAMVYLFQEENKKLVLNYHDKENKIYFEGRYFTNIKNDTLNLSINSVASLFGLDSLCIDSISLDKNNKIEIWLNK